MGELWFWVSLETRQGPQLVLRLQSYTVRNSPPHWAHPATTPSALLSVCLCGSLLRAGGTRDRGTRPCCWAPAPRAAEGRQEHRGRSRCEGEALGVLSAGCTPTAALRLHVLHVPAHTPVPLRKIYIWNHRDKMHNHFSGSSPTLSTSHLHLKSHFLMWKCELNASCSA